LSEATWPGGREARRRRTETHLRSEGLSRLDPEGFEQGFRQTARRRWRRRQELQGGTNAGSSTTCVALRCVPRRLTRHVSEFTASSSLRPRSPKLLPAHRVGGSCRGSTRPKQTRSMVRRLCPGSPPAQPPAAALRLHAVVIRSRCRMVQGAPPAAAMPPHRKLAPKFLGRSHVPPRHLSDRATETRRDTRQVARP
jgi:hypothetical protein